MCGMGKHYQEELIKLWMVKVWVDALALASNDTVGGMYSVECLLVLFFHLHVVLVICVERAGCIFWLFCHPVAPSFKFTSNLSAKFRQDYSQCDAKYTCDWKS